MSAVQHITGNDLTLEIFADIVLQRRAVMLAPDAREAVETSRAIVDDLVLNDRTAYAITTGVGQLADVRINREQARILQVNLVRSHAVGVGEPLSEQESRAMMLLRANSLAKGFSGVRDVIIDTLCEMLNRGVHPVIPSQGSVGASGDLAPLSHLAAVLIGEGDAYFADKTGKKSGRRPDDPHSRRLTARETLKRADIKPIVLEAKEAI